MPTRRILAANAALTERGNPALATASSDRRPLLSDKRCSLQWTRLSLCSRTQCYISRSMEETMSKLLNKRALLGALPTVLLAASLMLNLAQYWNSTSKASSSRVTTQVLPAVGQELASLHVITSDGRAISLPLRTSGKQTVLYVLSPTCKWCKLNQKTINSLSQQSNGRFQVIGLMAQKADSESKKVLSSYAFPVYTVDATVPYQGVPLDVTPRTFVVSPSGHVAKRWEGAYSDVTLQAIAAFLHVELPQPHD
ncbi:hypothetical protein Terro_3172 [Terriglobus roseus DSM 18391]|uniref:Thioredoxin domain-containing protein n=2 Tax=Terriglobus roseus TaxID=392734 RepID=I3ZJH6_TERRK|nr:hypothetical protein Terro_3172 [Terriglobus roseus DSM 18391]